MRYNYSTFQALTDVAVSSRESASCHNNISFILLRSAISTTTETRNYEVIGKDRLLYRISPPSLKIRAKRKNVTRCASRLSAR